MTIDKYRKVKPHLRPDHPEPVNSSGRQPLWDDEQTTDHYAGRPWSPIAGNDHPDDLLDVGESAALVGLDAPTWSRYQDLPKLNPRPPRPVPVHRVDGTRVRELYWRRGDLLEFLQARSEHQAGGGRPKGVGNLVPVEEIRPRAAALLARNPRITIGEAAEAIGVGEEAAQEALAAARADAVEEVLKSNPRLSTAGICQRLGYAEWMVTRARETVDARRRADAVQPYIRRVTRALEADGYGVVRHAVRVRARNTVGAAVYLHPAEDGPAALVWDERYGWRTDPGHPKLNRGEAEPPTGEGIRYYPARGLRPAPKELLAAIQDGRAGRNRPD